MGSRQAGRWGRLLGGNPFLQFALAGLVGLVAIGVAGVAASNRAGESEAMADVRSRTKVVAVGVVQPLLTPELLAGDPAALERLDTIITERVLDGTTRRVKLWRADGTILYSDDPRLIGERYELDEEKQDSLWSGAVVSEISDLDGPENRFDTEVADEMLEVYLPIQGPDGPVLYESYFDVGAATDSADRIRGEFVPIILAALILLEAVHLALALGLTRRLRRDQAERERLLQRAIDASDLERRRIAADLHDGVVQDLVGSSFAVSAAVETANGSDPELADDLRSAAVSSRRSLQALRSLLVEIYPPKLHQLGLEAALVDLLAPAANLGIETELVMTGGEPPPEVVSLIYRVVQESVRNVYRHAEASSLEIRVEETPTAWTATVVDDGRGFPAEAPPSPATSPASSARRVGAPASPDRVGGNGTGDGGGGGGGSHLGLRLLSDLASDAGAAFSVRSNPGSGTIIHLEVPS